MDYQNLSEFLTDMARRDRREVDSRLTVLVTHLLKWSLQPTRRSGSWRAAIVELRQDFTDLLESGVLHNHAEENLSKAYAKAIERAAAETGMEESQFPPECPFTLEHLLDPRQLDG